MNIRISCKYFIIQGPRHSANGEALAAGIDFSFDLPTAIRYYQINMKAIITVVGGDKVGIIAKVSAYLAEHSINIADITQTILSGNFVMMMMVDFSEADIDIDAARKDLSKKAEELGVEVNVMNEKVFSAMHRI